MRLTFLGPPGQPAVASQRPTLGRSDWEREYARLSEPIEQPLKARLKQISVGIGLQSSVYGTGMWIIWKTHGDLLAEVNPFAVPFYLFALALGLFVLSTLVSGGVAGAWCVNWALQGIAVGFGYLATAALGILLFVPWSWLSKLELPPVFIAILAAGVAVRVGLTTLGALLGHLLIRPIRVPLDPVH